jgi:hypothetical protein
MLIMLIYQSINVIPVILPVVFPEFMDSGAYGVHPAMARLRMPPMAE